ncbi:transcriptional regulator domain-containing protein [Sandaracinobacteroides hominis]|uniref:transcriptional regulator domain-containing protein n=1 Tax=Sandaracinobacteroides hominis TaxID=2780086 RepID=UPI0038B649D6
MTPEGRPPLLCWRDAAPYARMQRIDRAGIMWEWLRRDPNYVAWHIQASTSTRGAIPAPVAWGLLFRGTSGPCCT